MGRLYSLSDFPLAAQFSFDGIPERSIPSDGVEIGTIGFDTTDLNVGDTFEVSLESWSFSYLFLQQTEQEITTTNDGPFTITVVAAAVPEPSSLIVLSAAVGLVLTRRRRSTL